MSFRIVSIVSLRRAFSKFRVIDIRIVELIVVLRELRLSFLLGWINGSKFGGFIKVSSPTEKRTVSFDLWGEFMVIMEIGKCVYLKG
ncbi:MAG: hypothetical protein RR539_07895 [Clostridium sp.]|uniref:hypothetical protein n=1 Tax=Clostridium sp. TaxID=1506 RepID=UPI002FC8FAD5